MAASTYRPRINLSVAPKIAQMAVGIHGATAIERYRLEELWCLHVYRYSAQLVLDGELFNLRPGHASVIPPGTQMEYRFAGRSEHAYVHFRLPGRQAAQTVPLVQAMGRRAAGFDAALREAVGWFDARPLRASARVWDLLWELSERPDAGAQREGAAHPAIAAALQAIELRLGEPLRVAQLARGVGLSHNHLTRLFRSATGTTVTGYVQRRRAERAEHLLAHTTLPIKAIAAEVGIPDPHLFNKTIRRVFGLPPKLLRDRRRAPAAGPR